MDTPGMRELQLWSEGAGIGDTFQDIERLALHCTFRDCEHNAEPGCAIRSAIADGSLDWRRYQNYEKMLRELRHLSVKQNKAERAAKRQKWKQMNKAGRDKRSVD
jgi:ribosome biogenesis GTPase